MMGWQVRGGNEAEVKAWLDQFWPSVLETPQHLVKQDATASVAICGGLVLKAYRSERGLRGWLSGLLRSRVRRAQQMGRRLKDAGLPVPDVLASAIVRKSGSIQSEYILTREIPNSQRLADLLQNPGLAPDTLNPIVTQLGELLGELHHNGLSNRDLKGGNVLVSGSGDELSLCIVDLDGIRTMPMGGQRRITRDFWPVLFSLALNGWDSETTRGRLLAAYHSRNPINLKASHLPGIKRSRESAMPGWVRVERAIRVSGLGKRILSAVFPETAPEWENRALRYWQEALTHLERVPASPEARVDVGDVDGSDKRYYFKRFLMRSKADTFKHLVRCSRAERTLRGNALAAKHGLGVPAVVCLMEVREYGLTKASVLITEEVANATTLRDLLTKEGDGVPSAERSTLITQLGEEVARWHAAGVVHGDMRHGNILCRHDGDHWAFVFVDNERTRSTMSRHERARNLVQLNMISPDVVPLRDRVLLWRSYCRTAPGSRDEKRQLRAEILAWTKRRWRKQGWLK